MLTPYRPDLHTPEMLASQIGRLYEDLSAPLLVGSLGRSAIYNFHGADPTIEFKSRGELPVVSGNYARDIDLVGAEAMVESDGPFPLDASAYNNPDIEIIYIEGTWRLQSSRRGFSEPIDSKVMSPVKSETVFGIPCYTVPLQTHKALHSLHGPARKKDIKARDILASLGPATGEELPDELYEPFRELSARQTPGITPKVIAMYRRYTPVSIERRLSPKTHFIGQGLRALDRLLSQT